MPKKKKKSSPAADRKIALAQHRNAFAGDLKSLLDKAVGAGIFPLIPKHEVDKLYMLRFNPVKIVSPEQNIPVTRVKNMQSFLTYLFKKDFLNPCIGSLTGTSYYEYFSLCYTIIFYARDLEEQAYPNAATVKKALAPFAGHTDTPAYTECWKKYGNFMRVIAMFYSDIRDSVFTLKFNQNTIEGGFKVPGFHMEVYGMQIPKIQVTLNGHTRPAYQLGWYVPEPQPYLKLFHIPSEAIFLPPGRVFGIYIQSHALNRLSERLQGLEAGILQFSILESLEKFRAVKNKRKELLIEYRLLGNKSGYFTAVVTENRIVLTTFLFLTNKGTPEAEKLQAFTGLTKEDINYLCIDKLSAFVHSDIAGNKRIKQLFCSAGCESLFKISKSLFLSDNNGAEKSMADLIAAYLQLDANATYFHPGKSFNPGNSKR